MREGFRILGPKKIGHQPRTLRGKTSRKKLAKRMVNRQSYIVDPYDPQVRLQIIADIKKLVIIWRNNLRG